MRLISIIGEYNPFHNGHLLHLTESKKQIEEKTGDRTAVICVMSGDFVQRGEPAIFSKHARAESAVRSGVDLVLELPLPWVLSSAEGFARGAVGIIGALGCIDYLSFGSECGDIQTLTSLATAIMDPSLDEQIRGELESGISYAAARQRALAKQIGSMADHLETPNNILAVEYLKALFSQHLRVEPMTVQRLGAAHDEVGGSASDIRSLIKKESRYKHYMTKEAYDVLKREKEQGRGPVFPETLETALISRYRMLSEEDYSQLPDAAEGLGNRLCAAAKEETTIDGILSAAKTKRYALSRIRRMYMCAALGIKAGNADGIPPYTRVLAANRQGREALKLIQEKSQIPIITKPAEINNLSDDCRRLFEMESNAHDLYSLGYMAREERRGLAEWRISPVMI